jgi:hypothetical protein
MKTLLYLQSVHGVTIYRQPIEVTRQTDQAGSFSSDDFASQAGQDPWFVPSQAQQTDLQPKDAGGAIR